MDGYSDLTTFGLGDMVRLAAALRGLADDSPSIEGFAGRLCNHLHDHLVDATGARETVLVRCYGTVPYAALPAEERDFVTARWGELAAGSACLTLLGTAGTQPAWNDRRRSQGHRVIPLTDVQQVRDLPMVAALLTQLGVDLGELFDLSPRLLERAEGGDRHRVFHVPVALGSAVIPAQDFVVEHAVESVLGFGGALPSGEVYAVVLFTSVPVPRETAQMFETVALSTTLAALEMLDLPIFTATAPTRRSPARPLSALQRSAAREGVLRALLDVHERVAATEADATRRALERTNLAADRYATLARTLQASLIPPELPTIPGVETGAFFRPAGDGSEVGGDFYDLFPLQGRSWGLVLGDVSGKGAGAAALTALARYTVRAAAFHADSGEQVLDLLDEALRRHDTDERYLTALFALLQPADGQVAVDLTLGGHPQPLLCRADGTVQAVGTPGSVLGLLPGPTYSQTRCVLYPGDALVAFTDGVTEARQGSRMYGEERLRVLLAGAVGQSAGDLARLVGADVLGFQGAMAHDDTAVVVLRCGSAIL